MKIMKKEYSLGLVTLGTLVLGIDYVGNLIPGLPAFFSLNRFLFLGIFAADLLFFSEKYLRSLRMYLVCSLILIGCLPFLLLSGGGGKSTLTLTVELAGMFLYLLFFYFNCGDVKAAGRISSVLFSASSLASVYVMGSQLGFFGYKTQAWRGAVEYTSASGIFDPNILTLNFLPVFAFGPLLGFRLKKISRRLVNLLVILYIIFCFVAFFHLNTRSGSLAVAVSLTASLVLRFIIIPREEREGRLNAFLFFAAVAAALLYVQLQYNILGTTAAIFGETYLSTDTSFAVRIDAYRYLHDSLLGAPSLFGSSYRDFWGVTEWVGKEPHCVFVDVYIKGGLLYLGTYLYLYGGSLVLSLRKIRSAGEIALRSCFAGFFCFLVGFLPLALTLSIDDDKLPWAIIGCVFGLALRSGGGFGQRKGTRLGSLPGGADRPDQVGRRHS